jgi:hypothetical protein
MASIAHRPAAFAIRRPGKPGVASLAADWLTLRPTDDGWSLVASDGHLVYRALGTRGRRQCLEFARARGVVAVLS